MTTLEILKAARELITPENAWTQRALARVSPHGREVVPKSDEARCWCSEGALFKVSLYDRAELNAARERLRGAIEYSIVYYNDTHTHAEVLAAFDRAIAAEEARQ